MIIKTTLLITLLTMNQMTCVMYSTIPEISNYIMDANGSVYELYTGTYVGWWKKDAQIIIPDFNAIQSTGIDTIEQFWYTCDVIDENSPDMIDFVVDMDYNLITRRPLPEYVLKMVEVMRNRKNGIYAEYNVITGRPLPDYVLEIIDYMYNKHHGLTMEPMIEEYSDDELLEQSTPVSPGSPRLYTIPTSNGLRRTLSGEIFMTDKDEWTPDMVKVGQFVNYKMVFLPEYHHLSGLVERRKI